jgi:hypothetical protein
MPTRLVHLLTITLALAGCAAPSSEPDNAKPPVTVVLSGAVEKGPFLLGSSVTVTPAAQLAALSAQPGTLVAEQADNVAGRVFKTETSNDLGEFELPVVYQGLVSIEGSGYYYNEATGSLSSSPLTLRAFHQVGDVDGSAHINVITHLTHGRVQHLMAEGLDAATAIQQAETELHAALGIGAPQAAGSELSLAAGDNDDDAYLFAVSTIFAQAAYIEAHEAACNCADSRLQQLLNTTAAAFATNGAIPTATKERLEAARLTINNNMVMAELAQRFEETGSSATIPDLNRVIPWTIPESVTSCAGNVVPEVSAQCKLALCGVAQRPIDSTNARIVQYWQDHISECGNECWKKVACALDNCTVMNANGSKWIDASCAMTKCTVDNTASVAGGAVSFENWFEHVQYWAGNGECD